jgi:hypothetical protein
VPILRTLLLYQTGLINMTGKRLRIVLTLYRTMQTKMLRGIRKKFMIVLLDSSGMYCDRIFMIEGQNNPTQHSKRQKPTRFKHPPCEMLPPFSTTGSTRNCSSHIKISGTAQHNYRLTWRYTYRGWVIRHAPHGGLKTNLKKSFWKVRKILI